MVGIFLLYFQLLSSFNYLDIRGDTYSSDNLPKEFYTVIYSGISCRDCYSVLEKSINEIDSSVNIFLAAEYVESAFARKKIESSLKRIMKFDKILFFSKNDNSNLIKQEYFSNAAPSLLYIDFSNSKLIYWKFENLFGEKYSVESVKIIIQSKLETQ